MAKRRAVRRPSARQRALPEAGPTAWTVGYSGHTPGSFIGVVREAGIECVVDVRSVPLSRKPGFSKRALAGALEQAGLGYLHVPELGAPRELLDEKKAGATFAALAERYRAGLARKGKPLAELEEQVRARRCALMCLEKDPTDCHRGILAAELSRRGVRVVHL